MRMRLTKHTRKHARAYVLRLSDDAKTVWRRVQRTLGLLGALVCYTARGKAPACIRPAQRHTFLLKYLNVHLSTCLRERVGLSECSDRL